MSQRRWSIFREARKKNSVSNAPLVRGQKENIASPLRFLPSKVTEAIKQECAPCLSYERTLEEKERRSRRREMRLMVRPLNTVTNDHRHTRLLNKGWPILSIETDVTLSRTNRTNHEKSFVCAQGEEEENRGISLQRVEEEMNFNTDYFFLAWRYFSILSFFFLSLHYIGASKHRAVKHCESG